MSSLVETFSMIVLFVISLPSLEGKLGDNWNSMRDLNILQALIVHKGELTFKVEKTQEIKLERHTNVLESQSAKHEQLQTYLKETGTTEIEDQLHTSVIGNCHLDRNAVPNRKLKLEAKPDIGAKRGKETKHEKQIQVHGHRRPKSKRENRIQFSMREHQRPYFGSSVSSLWRRGQGPSGMQKSELGRRNSNEYQQYSNAKGVKPSSSTKSIPSGSIGRNSQTGGSGGHTSGYSKKPSGLPKPNGSQELWQPTHNAYPDQRLPPDMSPPKSTEVNQMWDYIHRHSKDWSKPEYYPPQQGKGKQPAAGGFQINSKPAGWTGGQKVSNSKEDRDARQYIKRTMMGWDYGELPPQYISPATSTGTSPSKTPQASRSPSPPQYGTNLSHLTNKELDRRCGSFITRVRSKEVKGRK